MRKTIVSTVTLIVLGLGTGDASAATKVTRAFVDEICGKGVKACDKCLPKCFDYQCKGNKCTMTAVERTKPQPLKRGIAPRGDKSIGGGNQGGMHRSGSGKK